MHTKFKLDQESVYQVIIIIIIGVTAVTALFPLLYVIGMSFTSQHEMIQRSYFVIIPHEPVLTAYKRILESSPIWMSMGVSFFRSIVGTLLSLVITMIGAYVLSKKTLPGRKLFLFLILATILFNGGLIPTYYVIKNLGLINSVWSMILPGLVDSFNLLVIKIFIENLPDSLIESVELDGATDFQLLIYIIIPLTVPALAAIGMFTVVNHWNSWFDALIYLTNKELYPLQMVLRNMMTSDAAGNDMMNFVLKDADRVSTESIKMATVVVGIVPILVMYPFLQKYFMNGIYMGSVKG